MSDATPTLPPIFTYLAAVIPVRCHEHVAIVHRGEAGAMQGTEFLREGLRAGHRCCCLGPAGRRAGMLARLGELGVDVQRHQQDQTLQFPPEAPDPGDLLAWASRFFAEAETAQAPAVRWLEEGIWSNSPGASGGRFFELHARLNYLVKQYPSVVLCDYDMNDMEISTLFSALAVHRHLLVEGTLVRDNPFYIPAEKFAALSPADRERDLHELFREVGFDLGRLLSTLAGYGQLQQPDPGGV